MASVTIDIREIRRAFRHDLAKGVENLYGSASFHRIAAAIFGNGKARFLPTRRGPFVRRPRNVENQLAERNAGMDNRLKWFFGDRSRLIALALLGFLAVWPVAGAHAQAIVGSVNGDPITSLDLAEREKLLRAIGQPSSPSAALDSMIETRVKAGEVNKYGIHVSASELGPTLSYYAEKGHMTLEAMSQHIQAAHVDQKHVENFFSIQQAFDLYARARNRAVEVSQADIDAELAHDKKIASEQTFTLRQVVLILSNTASPAAIGDAAKKMEGLRARFTDCDGGAKVAAESGAFVVREPITRTSSQLGDQLVAILDKTPVGHLTPPSRDSTGLVAVAVCSRKAADTDAAKDLAQQKVMQRIVKAQAQKLYEEVRGYAVIVKKGK
jgi:peptidyl-prolyl cis-trans isomerase SurA